MWTKVIYLKQGMEIAVSNDDGSNAIWDTIIKIEILPSEQVYDIEVEGTHNFIGNDIVAHNTYINGGLGVGTTETTNGNITGTGRLAITGASATSTIAGGLAIETSGLVYDWQTNNVGIGTAGPALKLEVFASSPQMRLTYSDIPTYYTDYGNNQIDFYPSSQTFNIKKAGTSLMTFQGNGNVGIGTTSPWGLLSVNPNGISGPSFAVGSSTKTDFVITNAGNVGIGTTSPWRTFSVNGTAAFAGLSNNQGGGVYTCVLSTGEMATSSVACGSSSARFKKDIAPLSYGLKDVLLLNSVSFRYNELYGFGDMGLQIGFIAEEVEKIIPEVVGYHDGRVQSVDYPKFSAVLVKAIQELNLKIENLQPQNNAENQGFFDNILTWFSDKIVSAKEFIGDKITTKKLCIEDVCVDRNQLKELLDKNNISGYNDNLSVGQEQILEPIIESSVAPVIIDTEPPVITINGNNPAEIEVGTSYSDMGASVLDNISQNLGVYYKVDGKDIQEIALDTSIVGTYIITYTAMDQVGNIGIAERQVIVFDPTPAPTQTPTPESEQTTISSSADILDNINTDNAI